MLARPLTFFFLLCAICSFGQQKNNKTWHFSAGAELRVTPILLESLDPNKAYPPNNIWPHEDQYLSGPAFVYSLEKTISRRWSFVFSQQLRYDLLNYTFWDGGVGDQALKAQRSFITDLGLDILNVFPLKKSFFKTGLGIGISGIGSNFDYLEWMPDPLGMPIVPTRSTGNYLYPFASVSFGWQKGRFQTYLKTNYCWDFPGKSTKQFLQPQLGVQYRLFSF